MKVKAILKMQVNGRDGVAHGSREVTLPCLPFEGLSVDGIRVVRTSWNTAGEVWELMLEGYHQPNGEARKNFTDRIAQVGGDAGKWQIEFAVHKPMTQPRHFQPN